LAVLHNFIWVYDSQAKTHLTRDDSDHAPGEFYAGDDSLIPAGTDDVDIEEEQISEATMWQNKIADDMWNQYQEVLHQQSLAANEESDEDSDSDEESDEESEDDFYLWLKQQKILDLHLHLHTKKNATVIYIILILSESTYHKPLQEQAHKKQLLCWACQKKGMQAWTGHQCLGQSLLTVLSW
jgi:hypothetical protein